MDTALPQKFSFILDRNLAKANCTENRVYTSCDTVVLRRDLNFMMLNPFVAEKLYLVCMARKWILKKEGIIDKNSYDRRMSR